MALSQGWVELPAGMFDIEAERARLRKQRDELETSLKRSAGKLANEGFLAKAATDIVAQEQEKHDRLLTQVAEIDGQLVVLLRLTRCR